MELTKAIDIFDDINKSGYDDGHCVVLPFIDCIIYTMYTDDIACTLLAIQKIKILFRLTQRGFTKSMFDDNIERDSYGIDSSYVDHKIYITKYYNTITNLFRLTNSDTIDVCKLDGVVIATIKVLLLIAKTRVASKSLPKYVILHKILLFYLGCQ